MVEVVNKSERPQYKLKDIPLRQGFKSNGNYYVKLNHKDLDNVFDFQTLGISTVFPVREVTPVHINKITLE